MKSPGIKVKVALATSITSVLMIVLVTAVQTQRIQQDFTRVMYAQQTALINRTAEELDDKLTMLLDIITLSALQQPPALARSGEQLRAYYQNRAVLALFDDLLVLSPQGIVIADLPAAPGRVGIVAADREYFKNVMRTRKPLISEPLLGRTHQQPIVQMVAPVLDANGEVVCVLVGVLRLYKDNLLGHLRNAKVGRNGYYFAVTRGAESVYVLHPDPTRLLKPRQPQANPATTRALNEHFEGTVDSVNSAGQRTLNSYKSLKSVDWVLAASLPAEEAYEPFNGVLYRLLLWGGLASLLSAVLIGWLALRLLAPLIRLRDAIVALRSQPSRFTPLPVLAHDEIGQLTSAFNDLMQERLAADARLQSVIEFAPNAIVVAGVDGRIETFNREGERCFGYPREAVLGQPLTLLLPLRLRAAYAAHCAHCVTAPPSAEPVRMGDGGVLYGLRQDGSEFPVEINLSTVHTDQGAKMLAVISDITERHRLQLEVEARATELERERDRAEAANRSKSEFVANMSHEIRTPMNAVLGMVYLLGNTALTAQQRKYLNMVRVSGQSLLGILNDVLDFSKIEARQMTLSPVDFSLDDVMNSLATLMTMNASSKELELAIRVDPTAPRQLRGDAMRLQQILVNLASNAIKFTEHGEVVVRIELSARDATHALLRFEVSDTGMGMTASQKRQLFQAFSQGDQSITRRFGGTGLGLAITRRLIELMGGQIAVRSEPGQGSCFWFSLSFDLVPDSPDSPNSPNLPDERRRHALGPLRLLIIDDNHSSRDILVELIRSWGWHADAVDSGAAALQHYQRPHPGYDVVLLDWHLSDMDGQSTARSLRAIDPAQPIVVTVNAFARDQLEPISNVPEADVVLVKPITSASLFDALSQALAAKSEGATATLTEPDITGSLAGRHLLLVEDNALNQAVARGIIELSGATLDVAGDGQQAVNLLREGRRHYDLILMDMQMPVMDGFTATRILRQQLGLTLPIIAMTAGVLESERDRSQGAGITDFIPKPIEVEQMLAVILRHLPAAACAPASTAADDQVFNMDSLMRVMGGDSYGRSVLSKIVRSALSAGMTPADQAGQALQEGRLRDAARAFHSIRGALGALGAKRLVQATIAAEEAIYAERTSELNDRYHDVRSELEQALAAASAWLECEQL